MITVNTKLVNILGNPLAQSFSPKMHNAAYKAMGLDAYFFPIETTEEHLGDVVNGLRYMNCVGFAVTKPYKMAIVKYMDELDEFAAKIGAVNTVVNHNGKFKGYNTDGEGGVDAIEKDSGFKLADTTALCIGAGGAARALCFTLANRGIKKIIVTTRREDKALELTDKIAKSFPKCQVATCDFHNDEVLIKTAGECQILMNNTGLGMSPHLGETPVTKKIFRPGQFAFDAIYNPGKTQFLWEAEAAGCRIQNGIGMIIGQGVLQIKHWFHQDPPLAVMEKAIAEVIAETSGK